MNRFTSRQMLCINWSNHIYEREEFQGVVIKKYHSVFGEWFPKHYVYYKHSSLGAVINNDKLFVFVFTHPENDEKLLEVSLQN